MNIQHYRRMLADRVRVGAFRRAIQATVRPGDVVVEVGAGLGTYAFFAARAGARRVYAIEADLEVCRLAECLAEHNGLTDRVRFLRGYSTDIELPERADVAIFEDYTSFFFSSRLRDLLRDTRGRLLKEGGRLIPRGVDLHIAGLSNARLYRGLDLHRARPDRLCGLDFGEARRVAMNRPHGVTAGRRHLITRPVRCARIDLLEDQELGFAFSAEAPATRGGLLHGLLGWMDLDLATGCRLSCSPFRPPTIWGQNLYPFDAPVRVSRGRPLKIGMELIFPRGLSPYVQRWTVSAGTEYREGNTFAGTPLSEASLRQDAAGTRRRLGPRSQALLTMLEQLRGGASYGQVASALAKRYPRLFETQEDALATIVRTLPALSELAGSL